MFNFALLLRFFIVGGSTGFLFLGIGYMLAETAGIQVIVASSIAFTIAIFYNYVLHYYWTYASDAPHGMALIRYLIMCAGAMCLNGLVMHLGLLLTSLHYIALQLLAGIAIISWTLTISFFWTFHRD